ncbi:MAG: hypothetical protein ACI4MT_05985 [Christensenellales bacterium]
MSFEEFLQELQKWLEEINNAENVDEIILDKTYFCYDGVLKEYAINYIQVEWIKDIQYRV